jgi:CheY-like chemotaxis protein
MKCLLVDDEPGIREGLAALLRRKGHDVRTAGDCAAAAAVIATGDFDLVVTDWRLPDGTAASFLDACVAPVIAVSGHPEEVEPHAVVRAVLTKPVAPKQLLDLCATFAAPAAAAVTPPPSSQLPHDVASLLRQARELLPADAAVEVVDDGTCVVLRAPWPGDAMRSRFEALEGDLRVLAPGGRATLEIRWLRDGRPAADVPVATPDGPWPAVREFAVDFDGRDLDGEAFGRSLGRARRARDAGCRVHFLNVPAALRSWAASQAPADAMPMRAPVGPRLPQVLADLWS